MFIDEVGVSAHGVFIDEVGVHMGCSLTRWGYTWGVH